MWSTARLSVSRHSFAAASVDDMAIFAGGYISGDAASDAVDLYNITTQTWSTSRLSMARGYLAAASVGNAAIFAGGVYGVTMSDAVDLYNRVTKAWSTARLSEARYEIGTAILNNVAIFAGGNTGQDSRVVDCYNGVTESWSTAQLSAPRRLLSGTSVGGLAFFAGSGVEVDIYDSTSGLWSTAQLSWPRYYGVGATSAGSMAIFAGGMCHGGGWGEDTDVVDLYNRKTMTWSVARLSHRRGIIAAASFGSYAIFAGGRIGGTSDPTNAVDFYNTETDSWSTAELSLARFRLAVTTVRDVALFAGGTNTNIHYNNVDIYTPSRVSLLSFIIASSDRIVGKFFVAVTLSFKPTNTIPPGGIITLSYPANFFASSISPFIAKGASSVTGLSVVCDPSSLTFIVMKIANASIDRSKSITITISGFQMGTGGSNLTDGIAIQTSTDSARCPGVNSGSLTCPAGSWWTGKPLLCVPCVAGTYQNIVDSSIACIACPPGTYNENIGSAVRSACLACSTGTYNLNFSSTSVRSCLACPAGMYCSGTGLSAASGNCPAMSFSSGGATTADCTGCPQGKVSALGSTVCQVQEHPVILFSMPGSIITFSEGSDLRRAFVADLAVLLEILERRIVIVSVKSGSIIVELAFLREPGSSILPTNISTRLKDAAAAGKLETFGVTSLNIGGHSVTLPVRSSLDSAESSKSSKPSDLSPGIISAIAGSLVAAFLIAHSYIFLRVKSLNITDSKRWIAASIVFGPFVWLFWSFRSQKITAEKVQGNHIRDVEPASGSSTLACLAHRVLDVNVDDFEMLNPIDGLEGQPVLTFKEITEARLFVLKFPELAKSALAAIKAGRQKVHKPEAQAYGLTVDDIAMIFLCVMLDNVSNETHFL